jgi:hypothetical protein
MALSILHERAKDKNGNPLEIDGHDVTLVEAVYRKWITSNNPRLQMAAIEYAFGKVPAAVELTGRDGGPIVTRDETVKELTDDELRRNLAEFGRVAALLAGSVGSELHGDADDAPPPDTAG